MAGAEAEAVRVSGQLLAHVAPVAVDTNTGPGSSKGMPLV